MSAKFALTYSPWCVCPLLILSTLDGCRDANEAVPMLAPALRLRLSPSPFLDQFAEPVPSATREGRIRLSDCQSIFVRRWYTQANT